MIERNIEMKAYDRNILKDKHIEDKSMLKDLHMPDNLQSEFTLEFCCF